ITVPYVVMHSLVMPDPATGSGIQCDNAIGKKIVTDPAAAVEVETGRSDGREKHAFILIQAEAGPTVGASEMLICRCVGPGRIALLAGIGNGVKDPAETAGVNIIGPDMAGGGCGLLGD